MANSKRSAAKKDETYTLTELVDLEKLQSIQDAFAEACQVAATITDINGVPITRPSNHSDVCTMIRASENGLKNCVLSGEHLGLEAARKMIPFHQECLSCGFTDAAAPIVVNDKHIANWLIGQYYVRNVDEQRIRQYSREIDVDESKMVQAFHKMPKISLERFEQILSFSWIMANEISEMGYQHLIQKRQTAELKKTQKQLERHQKHLEDIVADRTSSLLTVNKKLKEEIESKDRIQKKQSRLVTAIENAAESIIMTNAAAKIIYVNPAFENLTGYSRNEVIGKNPRILRSGIHDKDFYRHFWDTISQGKVWTGRFRNKNKRGELYDEDATVSSVKDARGKIINYVAVKRNVTKELAMERQLAQKSKLESIGTIAEGLAHEINTPIQYVLMNTQFLEEAIDDLTSLNQKYEKLAKAADKKNLFKEERDKIREYADEIDLDFLKVETKNAIKQALEGIEKISTIVTAMKNFAQPENAEKQMEDVNQLIENIVTVSQNVWNDVADLKTELSPDLPAVPLLAGQFKQSLLHLITNAAHAISDMKEKSADKGTITISTSLKSETVVIVVEDTGKGIPQSEIGKVFDPFYTTRTVGKGIGHGLAITYSTIVDVHGGTIQVESEQGVGTRFTVSLPIELNT